MKILIIVAAVQNSKCDPPPPRSIKSVLPLNVLGREPHPGLSGYFRLSGYWFGLSAHNDWNNWIKGVNNVEIKCKISPVHFRVFERNEGGIVAK